MSLQPHTLVRAALAIILLGVISHTRADPDLWGHVRFGGDIVAEGAIPRVDPYSFLSDRTWVNHEWLAECVMYLAYAAGGGPGLAALKLLLVVATLGIIWRVLVVVGIAGGSRDLLTALAVIGTFPQANHVRPQAFSLVAFACLMTLLLRGRTSPRCLIAVPILFAVWVNFHGGWIVGGGVLAVWTLCVLAVPDSRRHGVRLLLVGVVSFAATLANPYGWNMWLFLWSTVGFGRAEITDWQPVYRLGTAYVAIWLLIMCTAVAGAVRAVRSGEWDPARLASVAMLGLASLQVNRLLAFFTIATVLCLGREVAAAAQAIRVPAEPSAVPPAKFAAVAATAIAVLLMAGAAVSTVRNLACVHVEAEQAEADVAPMVQSSRLQGRLALWFDWGEYAIWHFAPALSVSIDGRRETVFSDAVMQKHLAFYSEPSSREAFIAEVRPDHIWLPSTLPVVSALRADGWIARYSGPRSVWLTRPGLAAGAEATALQPPPVERGLQAPRQREALRAVVSRCFPGP